MKESDIMHEVGRYWVCRERDRYTVCRNLVSCAETVQSFARSEDGLSLAIAYSDYLAGRETV